MEYERYGHLFYWERNGLTMLSVKCALVLSNGVIADITVGCLVHYRLSDVSVIGSR